MYQQEDFETARALIDYLSPLNHDRWPRERYVFRGQPCATYPLAPAAYRSKGVFTATSLFRPYGGVKGEGQVFYEAEILKIFLNACDGSGLQVAGDSPAIRKMLGHPDYYYVTPNEWPPEQIFPVLATAQHHGAPTCLLDWTRRSFAAAYFAASEALKASHQQYPPPSHLAVWALSIHHRGEWEVLSFVEMPGGTSANLAAQAGVFTVSGIKATRGEAFESTALEYQDDVYRHETRAHPGLIKMTLPVEEAGELLQLCEDLGVKGSVLFPGYEGAAREVNDFAYASLPRNID